MLSFSEIEPKKQQQHSQMFHQNVGDKLFGSNFLIVWKCFDVNI